MSAGSSQQELLEGLPAVGRPFMALRDALWQQAYLPADILALCHQRIAQLHGAQVDQLAPEGLALDPDKLAAVPHWPDDSRFSAQERACLTFTEVYVQDCQALSDDQAEAVKAHFGDAGLVALVQALGVLDSLLRLQLMQPGADIQEQESE